VTGDFLLAENRYGRYAVPVESRRRRVSRAVLHGEVYEPDTTAFIAEEATRGDVVTAGAYFGDMLPAAASGGNLVFSAEPNPVNFEAALQTLKLNSTENVRLANAAFGARSGSARLQVDDGRRALGGGSRLVPARQRTPGVRFVACDIVRVDAVVDPGREIVLIHLDVEGSEARALRGALRTIRRWLPDLLLERPPTASRIWQELAALGYRDAGRISKNRLLVVR